MGGGSRRPSTEISFVPESVMLSLEVQGKAQIRALTFTKIFG